MATFYVLGTSENDALVNAEYCPEMVFHQRHKAHNTLAMNQDKYPSRFGWKYFEVQVSYRIEGRTYTRG